MSAHQRWRLGVLAWSLAGSAGVVSAIILIVWLVQGYIVGPGCHR